MRKLILAAFMLIGLAVNAQAPLEKGETQLNAGLGLSGWGTPVYVGVDFGMANNFTLGIEGSYRSYKQTYFGGKYNSSIIGIQGNGNYHFNEILNIPSEWDFYGGLSLNYYIWNNSSNNNNFVDNSGLGVGVQIGGRYFFSDNFGLNLEFGGGNATSGGKFGITYKF